MTIVEVKRPPTTTVAKGLWISAPGPLASNRGITPKIVVKVVMSTGLNLELTPSITASFIVAPALSNERNARLIGVVYGSTMGGVVGGLWGALLGAVYHARYKPPIDVLIDDDAWQIEPLR